MRNATCALCHKTLTPEEPLYHLYVTPKRQWLLIGACCLEPYKERDFLEASGCLGCGRAIIHQHSYRMHKPFCSYQCSRRYYNTRRHKVEHTTAVCPECAREFTQVRSDQVYCDNVCRQRAYRARNPNVVKR